MNKCFQIAPVRPFPQKWIGIYSPGQTEVLALNVDLWLEWFKNAEHVEQAGRLQVVH